MLPKLEFYSRMERASEAIREIFGDEMSYCLVACDEVFVTMTGNINRHLVSGALRGLADQHERRLVAGELIPIERIREQLDQEPS